MAKNITFEKMANQLEATGDYRVLRRLIDIPVIESKDEPYHGIYLDVETTGLDTDHAEVIELGMVPFNFTASGLITAVGKPFHSYHEPSEPISAEITKITGITNDMVKGYSIDRTLAEQFISPVHLVVAHNSQYDRPMVERCVSKKFESVNWGCSLSQVPWEGSSKKLESILYGFGRFYKAHNAVADCIAGLYAIGQFIGMSSDPVERAGKEYRTGLSHILEAARKVDYRVWAIKAPFEMKDVLKNREYRWNSGEDGQPKAWWRDVEDSESELEWLGQKVYGRAGTAAVRVDRNTAKTRFVKRYG